MIQSPSPPPPEPVDVDDVDDDDRADDVDEPGVKDDEVVVLNQEVVELVVGSALAPVLDPNQLPPELEVASDRREDDEPQNSLWLEVGLEL